MKILLLCNKMPYPPAEGGPIAMNAIINGLLNEGHDVKVLAMKSSKFGADPTEIPQYYLEKTGLEYSRVDLRIKPIGALVSLLRNESYHVRRFISRDFKQLLTSVLQKEKFDIVQLETLYMTPYVPVIRQYSEAAIVLRSHNIEHRIWKRIVSQENNPLKRIYLSQLANALLKYELKSLALLDGIACITEKDARWYASMEGVCPVHVTPFGLDVAKPLTDCPDKEFFSVFHLGSMDWMPNIEGIKWFIENVWPMVHKEIPGLLFYLAGRNMPSWLLNGSWPGIVVVGEVEDANAFIMSKGVLLVPLLSGSGVRIKILEAMRVGIPVISSTVGAEGIEYTEGKDIMLADEPGEWVEKIRLLAGNRQACEDIGKAGKSLVEDHHNNLRITAGLVNFYESLIRKEK